MHFSRIRTNRCNGTGGGWAEPPSDADNLPLSDAHPPSLQMQTPPFYIIQNTPCEQTGASAVDNKNTPMSVSLSLYFALIACSQ